jgi:hypothetical protein
VGKRPTLSEFKPRVPVAVADAGTDRDTRRKGMPSSKD